MQRCRCFCTKMPRMQIGILHHTERIWCRPAENMQFKAETKIPNMWIRCKIRTVFPFRAKHSTNACANTTNKHCWPSITCHKVARIQSRSSIAGTSSDTSIQEGKQEDKHKNDLVHNCTIVPDAVWSHVAVANVTTASCLDPCTATTWSRQLRARFSLKSNVFSELLSKMWGEGFLTHYLQLVHCVVWPDGR